MAFPHVRVLTVLCLVIVLQSVTAKRGCSAFGHSCFGGHGKRSALPAANGMARSEGFGLQQHQLGQEEAPPFPDYPRSEFLASGDNIIPIRDGGLYEHYENAAPVKEMIKFRLKNIVKRWMENYKKSQRVPDYGFNAD